VLTRLEASCSIPELQGCLLLPFPSRTLSQFRTTNYRLSFRRATEHELSIKLLYALLLVFLSSTQWLRIAKTEKTPRRRPQRPGPRTTSPLHLPRRARSPHLRQQDPCPVAPQVCRIGTESLPTSASTTSRPPHSGRSCWTYSWGFSPWWGQFSSCIAFSQGTMYVLAAVT